MSNDKCPCEECIVLAICKCRIRDIHKKKKKPRTFSSVLKCEILNNYLKREAQPGYKHMDAKYRIRIDETREVYGLIPIMFKGRN